MTWFSQNFANFLKVCLKISKISSPKIYGIYLKLIPEKFPPSEGSGKLSIQGNLAKIFIRAISMSRIALSMIKVERVFCGNGNFG